MLVYSSEPLKLSSIILSCLVCWMDGINSFAGTFSMFLFFVDDALASLHENQGVASLDLVFFRYKKKVPVLLPLSPFCRCSLIRMVFQGKCIVLSDLLFCPSMFRKIRAIFWSLIPSFKKSLALTILWKFRFTQHILCFVTHVLTQ